MTSFATLLQQGNAWLFVPSAILLGALHGLEPGHSKTMMAAFIVAIRGTMTQAVLPQLRECGSGVVVNVTSSATLAPMPLVAVYTASKMAIEGFTGSLAYELAAFNVRVKLVEPGYGPTTRFTQNTGTRMEGTIPEAYTPFAQAVLSAFSQPAAVTTESDVAEAVWRAANDVSGQLRFPAGADAAALAQSK